MRPFVVLGARGMLGRAFTELLSARGLPFEALTRADLDVEHHEALRARLGEGARTIVNCVAYTDVDGAEADEARAFAVNAHAVFALARHAEATGSVLVHFSTDYVFDGRASAPYEVAHPRAPLNAYGRSKAAGEEAIEASSAEHLVLRTSWLYAPWSKSFVRTIAAASRARPKLSVVDDQRGRPTSVLTLARTTLALLDVDARGFFHATDGGECTWYELAKAVAAQLSPACVVEPCTSDQFPRPAPRPAYSVLDLSRTEATLGRPQTGWQEALDEVLARLEPL